MFGIIPFGNKNNNLSNYNPFKEIDEFEKDFFNNGFFKNNDLGEFKTDIKDNGSEYVLEADLPGFKKEDINIDISNDYLTISANRKNELEEKDKKGNYIRMERSYGSFSRSFSVADIDTEKIGASYNDGVLKLNMPKKENLKEPTRHLEIK